MKFNFLMCLGMLLFASNVWAEESKKEEADLRANFRRVALDLSSTEVKNADKYQDSSVTELSADSETVVKGVFDFVLEYEQPTYQWNNSVYMEYGRKNTRPTNGPEVRDENADEILLTTDYTRKVWRLEEADAGYFISLGYQTEFTDNDDSPRSKILRSKTGLRIFNGENFKDLYVALVGEEDMTYSEANEKAAWEIGTRYEYPLREGVKFQLEGYYRHYFSYSQYRGSDLKYDLSVVARMDVKVHKELSLSPFMSYTMAESREAGVAGSNFTIGLSFSYADIFNL